MKNTLNYFILCLFIFSSMAIISCNKNETIQPEEKFDFAQFEQEIINNANYKDYINAKETVSQHVLNEEIDLVEIFKVIQKEKIKDFCSFDQSLVQDLKGSNLFFDSYCVISKSLINLTSEYGELKYLKDYQVEQILQINDRTKAVSCIEMLHVSYHSSLAYCLLVSVAMTDLTDLDFCVEAALDIAEEDMDECCAAGGSGC